MKGDHRGLTMLMVVGLVLVGFGCVGRSEEAEKTAEELLPVTSVPHYRIGKQIGMARLMRSGDFNEDGNADLLILATASYPEGTRPWKMRVVLLLGDGAGGFHSPQVMLEVDEVLREGEPVRGLGGIAVGDFDLDGHLDFAVTDSVNEGVWVFWGDGTGGFSTTFVKAGDGFTPSAIVSGDFSASGQPQLAAIDPLAGLVYVFSPAEGRDILVATTFSLPDDHVPLILDAASFGDDGYDDLIVLGYKLGQPAGAVAFIAVISASGMRGFELRSITYVGSPAPVEPPCLAIGDYDRDGYVDILTVRNQHVFVLWGEGEGVFLVRKGYPVLDPLVVQLLLADIDRDGCLNIVLVGMMTQRVWVSSGCYEGIHHIRPVELSRPPCCAVIADVNGDEIPDLIVATSAWGDWTYLEVFLGKGRENASR